MASLRRLQSEDRSRSADGGNTRFRNRKKASSFSSSAGSSRPAVAGGGGGGGGGVSVVARPNHDGAQNGGSQDESFFETRPWMDSDCEDDFYSIRGEFTPSRGSTPDRRTQAGTSRSEPAVAKEKQKKQKLLELLQEKQFFDDDDADRETGIGSIVYAEEHLEKSSVRAEKAKKSSRAGCFPGSVWRINLRAFWRRKNKRRN